MLADGNTHLVRSVSQPAFKVADVAPKKSKKATGDPGGERRG